MSKVKYNKKCHNVGKLERCESENLNTASGFSLARPVGIGLQEVDISSLGMKVRNFTTNKQNILQPFLANNLFLPFPQESVQLHAVNNIVMFVLKNSFETTIQFAPAHVSFNWKILVISKDNDRMIPTCLNLLCFMTVS